MRWFKKIVRAILALLPVFSIFFIVNGSSYALEYQYMGLTISDYYAPPLSSSSPYYIDWSSTSFNSSTSPYFSNSLIIESSYFNKPELYSNKFAWIDNFSYSNGLCSTTSPNGTIRSIFSYDDSTSTHIFSLNGRSFFYNDWLPSSNPCYSHFAFGSTIPSFNESSLFSIDNYGVSNPAYNDFDPTSSLGLIFPFKQSQDILMMNNTSVSGSDGFSYSASFNFNRLATFNPSKFSSLTIPLDNSDGWFVHSDNLYSGRSFEFKFLFNFLGSFSWNSDLSSGHIQVRSYQWKTTSGFSPSDSDFYFDCTSNLQVVSGATHLEITCPVILPYDMVYFNPVLEIYNPDFVWDTDNIWEFYGAWLTTDNDHTPGGSWNNNPQGSDPIWLSTNGVGGDNIDFDYSLTHLFNFNFINPFAPLFQLFTDNSSCVQIPTIAGMIHSEETQVCPWFDTTTRAIVTPILGISSMMLLFGFAVRWLGSSSGNMFEDQTSHKWGNTQIRQRGKH